MAYGLVWLNRGALALRFAVFAGVTENSNAHVAEFDLSRIELQADAARWTQIDELGQLFEVLDTGVIDL